MVDSVRMILTDDPAHECPGGCGTVVTRVFCCLDCFKRLPETIRSRLNATVGTEHAQYARAHGKLFFENVRGGD